MRWPFAARLAGAFAALGCRVEALCPPGHVLAASRHPRRLYTYHPLFPRLAEAIAIGQPDLVVPCDDPVAQLLARFAARAPSDVAARLAFSLGEPATIARLTSRNLFLAEAEKIGVRIGENMPVADDAMLDAALARLGVPVVVKADNSWGGDGVVIARSADQAREAFRRFAAPSRLRGLARAMRRRESHHLARVFSGAKAEIGLQKFIPGHPATSSIACWRGAIVGANHFDVVVSQGTGPATVIAPVACPDMADFARAIARHFNLTGLYGLDYMRDAEGKVHLLEINPRATPSAHLALASDPVAALAGAAGGGALPRPAVTARKQIALFPQEYGRDPASPWLETAFHDIPADDPGLVAALLAPDAGFTGKAPEIAGKSRAAQA